MPKLTINNSDFDKSVLHKEVAELKERSEQRNAEKEKEAEETKKELERMRQHQEQQTEQLSLFSEQMQQMRQLLNEARDQLPWMNPAHKETHRMAKILIKDRLHLEEQLRKQE